MLKGRCLAMKKKSFSKRERLSHEGRFNNDFVKKEGFCHEKERFCHEVKV
jgi:hypothetical protein